jgi:hypothetical protein
VSGKEDDDTPQAALLVPGATCLSGAARLPAATRLGAFGLFAATAGLPTAASSGTASKGQPRSSDETGDTHSCKNLLQPMVRHTLPPFGLLDERLFCR